MELYKEILAHALIHGEIQITFSSQEPDVSKNVGNACYKAMNKIKAVIEDDSLDDKACFMKIEEIIFAFEDIGSSGGNRHDFG